MKDDILRFYEAIASRDDFVFSSDFKKLSLDENEVMEIYKENKDYLKYLLYVKKLPFASLDFFARVASEKEQWSIARKWPLLNETYEYLASQSEMVRSILATNKGLPRELLTRLKRDRSDFVRERAEAAYQKRFGRDDT